MHFVVTNNSNAVSTNVEKTNDEFENGDTNQDAMINDIVLLEHELELLHISRQDNPYLQLLTSQDNLDKDTGDRTDSSSILSPEPPFSSGSRSPYGVGGE